MGTSFWSLSTKTAVKGWGENPLNIRRRLNGTELCGAGHSTRHLAKTGVVRVGGDGRGHFPGWIRVKKKSEVGVAKTIWGSQTSAG